MSKTAVEAPRTNCWMMLPEELRIQDDPKGKYYDRRIELPLKEETVLNIMSLGVAQTITAVKDEDGIVWVTDGRQRVRHLAEANKRLLAQGQEAKRAPVMIKKDTPQINLLSIALNEHRQDDTPLLKVEKAMTLLNSGYTEEQVANSFRISVAQLKNWQKIDSLCAPVKKLVENGQLTATAASKLAGMETEQQKEKAKAIIETPGKPTVEKARNVAKGTKTTSNKPSKKELTELEKRNDIPYEFKVFIQWINGHKTIEEMKSKFTWL